VPNSAEGIKADFFKALAHPARIRILNALRDEPELSVGQLQERLDLEQSVVSQQLSVLRAKGLLESRKVGTTVLYAVRDRRIHDLLATALAIISQQVEVTQSLLDEYDAGAPSVPGHPQENAPHA
jgi:DNA-binding transcriptional ArsR family regulator